MNLDISGVDLTGQVAIVIGSEFALSRIIAQALESAGAAVALVVKTERELVEMTDLIYDTDGRIRIIVADTSNQNAVERVVQNYKDHLGFITMVVNVVDIARLPVSLWQIDPDEWSSTLEANLRRSLLWTKTALPEMVKGGRIINIAASPIFSRLMSSLTAEAKARGIALFSVDSGADPDLVKRLILFLAQDGPIIYQGILFRLAMASSRLRQILNRATHSGCTFRAV